MKLLYITSALAPFSPQTHALQAACAHDGYFLVRALAALGVEVTVVLLGPIAEPERSGLARRLSPLTISSSSSEPTLVTVYEGAFPGGRVALVALSPEEGKELAAADGVRAALHIAAERGFDPEIVMATHGTELAIPLTKAAADGPEEAPLTVFCLRQLDDTADLRDALASADRVIVPSTALAQELRQIPESYPDAALLAPALPRLFGIPHGVDTAEWNPAHDTYLTGDLTRDPREAKRAHKRTLQRELGLRVNPHVALLAVQGPMDDSIVSYAAATAMAQWDLQIVFVPGASTERRLVADLGRVANQKSTRVAVYDNADEGAARAFHHRLLAAADLTLIAHDVSAETTCDLQGMLYGAAPIAPQRGMYADYLVNFDPLTATGNGFLFPPGEPKDAAAAVLRALRAYEHSASFTALIERILTMDLSWHTTAQRYVNVLLDALRSRVSLAA